MHVRTLTAEHARRFFVRRHLLSPPRALPADVASVMTAIARLGSFQFDPLEVPGARNHDLVLHARIAGYRRGWCEQLLYGPADERRLFEAYNKSLNILPIEELHYYRMAWERASARYDSKILRVRAQTVAAIVARLNRDGALSTASFTGDLSEQVDWHWAPTSEGRAVLEALFETGRVAISRREGNRRFYDLTERLFPASMLSRRATSAEAHRHRLLSRYRGVGLMGAGGATELVLGIGSAAERAGILARLVEDGTLQPVEVEGVRGLRYVLAEESALLDASATRSRRAPAVTFIAPLDPFVWDRRLLRSLFQFDYIWEVYTPVAKRRHGYYVLPLLFGDRLVGRIEPQFDRAEALLHIASLSFEPGFEPLGAAGFTSALATAVNAYARFVGAKRVTWARTRWPQRMRRAIAQEASAR